MIVQTAKWVILRPCLRDSGERQIKRYYDIMMMTTMLFKSIEAIIGLATPVERSTGNTERSRRNVRAKGKGTIIQEAEPPAEEV